MARQSGRRFVALSRRAFYRHKVFGEGVGIAVKRQFAIASDARLRSRNAQCAGTIPIFISNIFRSDFLRLDACFCFRLSGVLIMIPKVADNLKRARSKDKLRVACGLLRRPLQIERAHEFSALVHEIDDTGMIDRIVIGFSPGTFLRRRGRLWRWPRFSGYRQSADDAGIEVFKIGLQNIRRVALGSTVTKSAETFLSAPISLKTAEISKSAVGQKSGQCV